MRAVAESRLNIPVLGCVAAGVSRFASDLGELADGIVGPSQWEDTFEIEPALGPTPAEFARRMRAAGAVDSPDYPSAQIYAAGLLTAAALASAGRLDDAMLRAAFSDLRTTTMFGDFSIDRVTGRQIGHQMLLVQWHRGRKVIIVPESHDDSGSLDFPAGWRLLLAGFQALRLSRPDDLDDDENEPTIRKWIKMSAITISLERGKVFAIGLMSGTSHDGVSAAVVELDERARPPARLIAFQTFPYPARLRKELLAASADEKIGAAAISTLNFALGREFGHAAIEIARRSNVLLSDVAFIGSHGHTFFHLPPRRAARGQIASTMQLGESAVIAAATGVPVVADFRTMDLALGGEGAPLAPLAHLWLFARSEARTRRAEHRRHRQRDLHSAARASR